MIYEWKCTECGYRVTVERTLEQYNVPPDSEEGDHQEPSHNSWVKVYNSSTNWETLRDRGILERLPM